MGWMSQYTTKSRKKKPKKKPKRTDVQEIAKQQGGVNIVENPEEPFNYGTTALSTTQEALLQAKDIIDAKHCKVMKKQKKSQKSCSLK